LYGGLVLVAIGGGAYGANLAAAFGKRLLDRRKLLDSGFTLLYLAASVGSTGGILLVGLAAERSNWELGFALSGSCAVLSLLPLLFQSPAFEKAVPEKAMQTSFSRRSIILAACLLVGLYSAFVKLGGSYSEIISSAFHEIDTINLPEFLWSSYGALFTVPLCIGAVILWSFTYTSQFIKLFMGCLIAALSLGLLLFIPTAPGQQDVALFFTSLFILCIAEVCIAPIIFSVLTEYANPKYLATLISLAFLPAATFTSGLDITIGLVTRDAVLQVWIGMLALVAFGFIILGIVRRASSKIIDSPDN